MNEPRFIDGKFAPFPELVVTIKLTGIEKLELEDFSHQNVVSVIEFRKLDGLYELDLGPCYGIYGIIQARQVSFELNPGAPSDAYIAMRSQL